MCASGENVERAKAGDKCVFSGALIVVPDVAQVLGTWKAGLVAAH